MAVKVAAKRSNRVAAPVQSVGVNFSLAGTVATFVFTPPKLDLPNTGGKTPTQYQVRFKLTSNIPGAVLTGDVPVSGAPPRLQVSGQNTTVLRLAFDNKGLTRNLVFNYEITVMANGQPFTSPDPQLEIPPPN